MILLLTLLLIAILLLLTTLLLPTILQLTTRHKMIQRRMTLLLTKVQEATTGDFSVDFPPFPFPRSSGHSPAGEVDSFTRPAPTE
jgi:hypothetical protein